MTATTTTTTFTMSPRFLFLLGSLILLAGSQVRAQDDEGGDGLDANAEELCQDRPGDEYFRLNVEGDCRDVVRCDKATEIGVTRLATVRCPTGLAFDIERQTCDWKTNVKNCDQLE
ncbi:PREDICTED: uncharacterized protein LOC107192307, partial [Dufourea novaeangliae]|uniref:uncharacterized protein LOC107192307 n=1 Tax=Dufourea novaeangliae TaxID=178035 RepID=UPI0007674CE6